MELNRNSNYNKWYLWFNGILPNNFCDYFWGSIKGLLMSILSLIFIFLICSTLIAPITLIWFNSLKGTFWDACQFIGIGLYIIGILGFIIYKIIDYFENKSYTSYKESTIKIWYKDFKNKHCTIITWKD